VAALAAAVVVLPAPLAGLEQRVKVLVVVKALRVMLVVVAVVLAVLGRLAAPHGRVVPVVLVLHQQLAEAR